MGRSPNLPRHPRPGAGVFQNSPPPTHHRTLGRSFSSTPRYAVCAPRPQHLGSRIGHTTTGTLESARWSARRSASPQIGRGNDQVGRRGPARGHFPCLLPALLGQLQQRKVVTGDAGVARSLGILGLSTSAGTEVACAGRYWSSRSKERTIIQAAPKNPHRDQELEPSYHRLKLLLHSPAIERQAA